MIQHILDYAEYRGPQFGYIVPTFSNEYRNGTVVECAFVAKGKNFERAEAKIMKHIRSIC